MASPRVMTLDVHLLSDPPALGSAIAHLVQDYHEANDHPAETPILVSISQAPWGVWYLAIRENPWPTSPDAVGPADAPLTYGDVAALAEARYRSPVYQSPTEQVFALLADVADCYVSHLEAHPAARDHPAPYVGWHTPMEAALEGLRDSLERKRDGRLPQHR